MPDESDLTDLFEKSTAPNTLDANRIIARSRARRLPKQVGAGLLGTLAVAGIFVVAVNTSGLGQQSPSSVLSQESSDAADTSGGAAESSIKRAPIEKINLCGGPLAEPSPSNYGLQLDVEFAEMAPVGADVTGTVRLTNLSDSRVIGTTAAVPALTFSQNGIVLWHSNGPMIQSLTMVDLEPGESMEYGALVTPVKCEVEDDAAESFRADLPALPAGAYELSALIDFSPDPSMPTNGIPELDLVSGPRSTITLG